MRLLLMLLLPQPQPWGQKKFTNQCIMNALRRAQGNQAQSHNVTLLQQFDAIQSSLSSTAPRRLTHMSPFLLKVAQGCLLTTHSRRLPRHTDAAVQCDKAQQIQDQLAPPPEAQQVHGD